MAIAKTAILRLDSARIETVEFVAPVIMMNVHRKIVENVEFARMMYASTTVNFVPLVQNVKMKRVYLQLNAARYLGIVLLGDIQFLQWPCVVWQ